MVRRAGGLQRLCRRVGDQGPAARGLTREERSWKPRPFTAAVEAQVIKALQSCCDPEIPVNAWLIEFSMIWLPLTAF